MTNTAHSMPEPRESLFSKLARGEYGLPRTYWLFGVLPFTISNMVLVPFILRETTPAMIAAVILLLILAYQALVALGTWRAANAYEGSGFFRTLGYIGSAIWWASLAVGVLSLIGGFVSAL